MAWIDYRKAYHFVPHSWINKRMEMFVIAKNVRNLLEKSMEQWKLSLTSNGEHLVEVNVKRDISRRQSVATIVCFEYGTIVAVT